MRISLVVPTLNEQGSIGTLFEGLVQVAQTLAPRHELEIVLVDDGSTDGTVAAARAAASGLTLQVVERRERGLATAVLTGFRAATGEVLGVMDADLSHPTEIIPQLIEALDTADLSLASRNMPGGRVEEWPWYRLYGSRCATLLIRPLGVRVSDPMSGYFFLHRRVLDGVACSPIGYKILLEVLVKGRYKNVHETPYVFRNRGVGKSKMGTRETLNYIRHVGRLYVWKSSAWRLAMRKKFTELFYRVRDRYVVWYGLLNRKARLLFVAHPVTLNSVEQRMVDELRANGIAQISFQELFSDATLLQEMRHMFDARMAAAKINPKKEYLLDPRGETFVLDVQDPFVRFAVSDTILKIVNGYMGMWTQFHDLVTNQTLPLSPGQPMGRSQLWHRDSHDIKVCKVFLYLNDVDETGGPFHYVRQSHIHGKWWSLYAQKRPSGSYPALEGVEEKLPAEDAQMCVGKAGTIIFCDTIGLHKGGYATTGTRKMVTASFISAAHTSLRRHYTLPSDYEERIRPTLAPEVQFALTVPVGTKPRWVL